MVDLNPILHQPTRLRIMTFLMHGRIVGFARLRDSLGLTDGNLAGHVQRLTAAGYVVSRRTLRGIQFEVQVSITAAGSAAIHEYAGQLRMLLGALEEPDGERELEP